MFEQLRNFAVAIKKGTNPQKMKLKVDNFLKKV
jgi:hypothetical protein